MNALNDARSMLAKLSAAFPQTEEPKVEKPSSNSPETSQRDFLSSFSASYFSAEDVFRFE